MTNKNLIFFGTVISIENVPLNNSILNWIITVNVDEVVSGVFSEETFQFRIHSPAKSGLEAKRQHAIEATLTQEGYIIDEFQWQKEKQKLPKNPGEDELKEIGLAMLFALEKWKDEPTFRLNKILRSSKFKPFSQKNYIADWYLDQDGYSLYCMCLGNDICLNFHIQFRNIVGKWRAMKPEIEKIWKAQIAH